MQIHLTFEGEQFVWDIVEIKPFEGRYLITIDKASKGYNLIGPILEKYHIRSVDENTRYHVISMGNLTWEGNMKKITG